jgi:hypothetical protein
VDQVHEFGDNEGWLNCFGFALVFLLFTSSYSIFGSFGGIDFGGIEEVGALERSLQALGEARKSIWHVFQVVFGDVVGVYKLFVRS